jgi:hypothetical protein
LAGAFGGVEAGNEATAIRRTLLPQTRTNIDDESVGQGASRDIEKLPSLGVLVILGIRAKNDKTD